MLMTAAVQGLFASAALGLIAGAAGIPPNPRRTTPPPAIAERALHIGDRAPPFSLPATSADRFVLADQLRRGPVALVFYRGFW